MRLFHSSSSVLLFLLLATNTLTAQENEVQKIDSLITQFYKSFSFNDGAWKDAEKSKGFFFDQGRIVANLGDTPQNWTLKQYITNVRERITQQSVISIEEKEIFQKTDVFGKVAQRLSTYEIHSKTKDKEIIKNGVNMIQLLKVNGEWKVYSLIWDRESAQQKIPAEFRPN